MRSQTVVYSLVIMLLFFFACRDKKRSATELDSKSYPYTDTISFGIKSDSSGHSEYALLEVRVKYIGKDTCIGLDGSPDVKIGSRSWHVVTYGIKSGKHH